MQILGQGIVFVLPNVLELIGEQIWILTEIQPLKDAKRNV